DNAGHVLPRTLGAHVSGELPAHLIDASHALCLAIALNVKSERHGAVGRGGGDHRPRHHCEGAVVRRRQPPSQTLPEVARIYREALANPDPAVARTPTEELGRRLGYSRGHAARL